MNHLPFPYKHVLQHLKTKMDQTNLMWKIKSELIIHKDSNHFLSIFNSPFIPNTLTNEIKLQKNKKENHFAFEKKFICPNNLTIHLYYLNSIESFLWNENDIICMLLQLIDFVESFIEVSPVFSTRQKNNQKNCKQKQIHICLNIFPKTFPIPNQLLTSNEINTAYTYHNHCLYIVLYRIEELFKVFLHELTHVYAIDIIEPTTYFDHYNQFVLDHFYIETKNNTFLFGEAFAEATAVVLHCIVSLNQQNNNNQQNNTTQSNSNNEQNNNTQPNSNNEQNNQASLSLSLLQMIENEITFSIQQCSRILHHFDFPEYCAFLKSVSKKQNNWFRETTSVFCYYFIKTALLMLPDQLFLKALWNSKCRNESKLLERALQMLANPNSTLCIQINQNMKKQEKKQEKQKESNFNQTLRMCKYSLWKVN